MTVSSEPADPAVSVAVPAVPAFSRSIAIVLAWNIVPCLDVVLTAATYVRDRPGCAGTCAFDGLALAAEVILLLLSLGLSVVLLAALVLLGRSWPRLKNAAIGGNLAAIPGVVLTAVGVYQLFSWMLS
jgi:hypothetical protein